MASLPICLDALPPYCQIQHHLQYCFVPYLQVRVVHSPLGLASPNVVNTFSKDVYANLTFSSIF